MLLRYFILTITLSTALYSYGQDAVLSGGESNTSITYSIGQINYECFNTDNGIISTGIQQPTEIFISLVNSEANQKQEVLYYPNPVSDYLHLNISNTLSFTKYELYNNIGKFLSSGQINEKECDINLSRYNENSYFVYLIGEDGKTLTLKLMKK